MSEEFYNQNRTKENAVYGFPSSIRQIGLLSLQTTIAAVTIALIAGSIHPVKVEAATVPAITQPAGTQALSPQFISNPSLTFVQENITFTKLTNLAGDSETPGIKIPSTTLPPIDTGFYFLHMYNAVTGAYVESFEIDSWFIIGYYVSWVSLTLVCVLSWKRIKA